MLATTGASTFFNGKSFTVDGFCIHRRSAISAGLFVAAGMNSQGIQLSGGVGKVMAQWIVGKD